MMAVTDTGQIRKDDAETSLKEVAAVRRVPGAMHDKVEFGLKFVRQWIFISSSSMSNLPVFVEPCRSGEEVTSTSGSPYIFSA